MERAERLCYNKRMNEYQAIRNKFILPNAREDWTAFRNALTDLLLEAYAGRIAVVGAGRCCDIDLHRVAASSEQVLLLDVDEESMREAVSALPVELQAKTELRAASITGIQEADVEKFIDEMLTYVRYHGRNLSAEMIRLRMNESLDRLAEKLPETEQDLTHILPEGSVDLLLCSGVHSQLFSAVLFFIRSLFHSLKAMVEHVDMVEAEVLDRIRSMNDQVIPVISDALYSAAGQMVIFGNEYMEQDPVEGAYQCIRHIREKYTPEEIHLSWEFNRSEGVIYDMLMQVCRKL